MTTTQVVRHIDAPASAVYRALLDPADVQQWMVPDGMTSEVHEFDAVEGGRFRISLTYDDQTSTGKPSDATDTFEGRFDRLVPDREVVQVVAFDSDDAYMAGDMTISYVFEPDADAGGTTITGTHRNLPPGVPAADNELGWRMSLDKLAALVEAR